MVRFSRRELLATSIVGITASSGCLDQVPWGSSCKLHHEVSKKETDGGYGGKPLSYSELSERGKTVFEKALEDGEYVTSYDGNNAPSDFSYSDEMTAYSIGYDGEKYVLLTYTGSGCEIE